MMDKSKKNTDAAASSVKDMPKHLKHKPVMGCNYSNIIKKIANRMVHGKSDYDDARYISIGHAQYNHDEASVKMMRHTGSQWSPQSEEVPIQRLPYMMVLLLTAIYKIQNTNEDGSCSDCIKEDVVSPQDLEFLHEEIKKWGNYLKDGIEGIKDLLSRIDTSKIGK